MMMVAYFNPPSDNCLDENGKIIRREAPILMLIPLVGLAIMSLLIGIRGNVILTDISENAARALIPGVGL
jgi:NADH:ubiquinone oxidoreductase subunit 5 (subunit L)/multisubunit Na+/H+ antiporter MnhA subunit